MCPPYLMTIRYKGNGLMFVRKHLNVKLTKGTLSSNFPFSSILGSTFAARYFSSGVVRSDRPLLIGPSIIETV